MKAQTRFKAIGSIAKLSAIFMNHNNQQNKNTENEVETSEDV